MGLRERRKQALRSISFVQFAQAQHCNTIMEKEGAETRGRETRKRGKQDKIIPKPSSNANLFRSIEIAFNGDILHFVRLWSW